MGRFLVVLCLLCVCHLSPSIAAANASRVFWAQTASSSSTPTPLWSAALDGSDAHPIFQNYVNQPRAVFSVVVHGRTHVLWSERGYQLWDYIPGTEHVQMVVADGHFASGPQNVKSPQGTALPSISGLLLDEAKQLLYYTANNTVRMCSVAVNSSTGLLRCSTRPSTFIAFPHTVQHMQVDTTAGMLYVAMGIKDTYGQIVRTSFSASTSPKLELLRNNTSGGSVLPSLALDAKASLLFYADSNGDLCSLNLATPAFNRTVIASTYSVILSMTSVVRMSPSFQLDFYFVYASRNGCNLGVVDGRSGKVQTGLLPTSYPLLFSVSAFPTGSAQSLLMSMIQQPDYPDAGVVQLLNVTLHGNASGDATVSVLLGNEFIGFRSLHVDTAQSSVTWAGNLNGTPVVYRKSVVSGDKLHLTAEDVLFDPNSTTSYLNVDDTLDRAFWLDAGGNVKTSTVHGENITTLISTRGKSIAKYPGSYSVDVATGDIYYIQRPGGIWKFDAASGQHVEMFSIQKYINRILVDAKNGRIYMGLQIGSGIAVANLDGSNFRVFSASHSAASIYDIDVDLVEGKVYWIDDSAKTYCLWKANLDGSNVQLSWDTNWDSGSANPLYIGLKLEPGTDYLYVMSQIWIPQHVFRMKRDGSEQQILNYSPFQSANRIFADPNTKGRIVYCDYHLGVIGEFNTGDVDSDGMLTPFRITLVPNPMSSLSMCDMDWRVNRLYYAVQSASCCNPNWPFVNTTLYQAYSNGTGSQRLFQFPIDAANRGLDIGLSSVDGVAGHLYTTFNPTEFGSTTSLVRIPLSDPTKRTVLVDSKDIVYYISALNVQHELGLIFFATSCGDECYYPSGTKPTLQQCALDGSNRVVLVYSDAVSPSGQTSGTFSDLLLAPDGKTLYATVDWESNELYVVDVGSGTANASYKVYGGTSLGKGMVLDPTNTSFFLSAGAAMVAHQTKGISAIVRGVLSPPYNHSTTPLLVADKISEIQFVMASSQPFAVYKSLFTNTSQFIHSNLDGSQKSLYTVPGEFLQLSSIQVVAGAEFSSSQAYWVGYDMMSVKFTGAQPKMVFPFMAYINGLFWSPTLQKLLFVSNARVYHMNQDGSDVGTVPLDPAVSGRVNGNPGFDNQVNGIQVGAKEGELILLYGSGGGTPPCCIAVQSSGKPVRKLFGYGISSFLPKTMVLDSTGGRLYVGNGSSIGWIPYPPPANPQLTFIVENADAGTVRLG